MLQHLSTQIDTAIDSDTTVDHDHRSWIGHGGRHNGTGSSVDFTCGIDVFSNAEVAAPELLSASVT